MVKELLAEYVALKGELIEQEHDGMMIVDSPSEPLTDLDFEEEFLVDEL